MGRSVTEYKVLIASPGDLQAQRNVARDTVLRWNESHSARQVVLTPVMWERDSTPEMGDRAQAILNHQIVDDCDVAIGMFWTRLGTPTGAALSGTVEELERLIRMDRRVSIFFSTAEFNPYALQQEEFNRVQTYRAECETRGLVALFATTEELREHLLRTLTRHVENLQDVRGGQGTLGAAPSTTAGVSDASALAAYPEDKGQPEPAKGSNWYALLRSGKYEDGLTALREAHKDGDVTPPLSEVESFAQLIAFRDGGVYQAFLDLESSVRTSPDNFEALFWYAIALESLDRFENAEAAMRTIATHHTDKYFGGAIGWLVDRLSGTGRESEARELWRAALASQSDPRPRARLVSRMADAYKSIEAIKNEVRANSLYEYALEIYPADVERRLTVAYRYGVELSVPSLGLFHYREVLAVDEHNPTALVNAGWAAEKLSFPITAVRYYRSGEKIGEALAATNLGWRLLDAGFADEAETLVATARAVDDGAAAADKLAVGIRERADDEESRWVTTRDKIKKVRQWRVKFAKAFGSSGPGAKSLTGLYVGTPNAVQLVGDEAGTVTGSLKLPTGTMANLVGRLEGKALSFTWSGIVTPGGLKLAGTLLSVDPPSGHGLFVVTDDALQGYTAIGAEPLDPLELDSIDEWDLRRTSSRGGEGVLVDALRRAQLPKPRQTDTGTVSLE
jgi:tetratricopeptide (TPR) repeat protein